MAGLSHAFAGWALRNARVDSQVDSLPTRTHARKQAITGDESVCPTLASPSICVDSVCFTLSSPAFSSTRPYARESCVLPLPSIYLSILLYLLRLPTSHPSLLYRVCASSSCLYSACTYYRANAADTKLPAITTHFLSLSRAHSRPPIQYKRAS